MALLLFSRVTSAYMYDVVSTTMVAPSSCAHGCAAWSTIPEAVLDSIWVNTTLATSAGRSCAQPGLLVNTQTYGAWCFCADGSGKYPTAPVRAETDPDHPFDGQTVTMMNTYVASPTYVSFAYTDAPPGETSSEAWMRSTYGQSDAMPLTFHAVAGKVHTYQLFNNWTATAGYDKWLSASSASGDYVHAWGATRADAMEVTLAFATDHGEYTMTNAADGTFISFCTSGCSNGFWIKSGYTALASAMTVKLVPYVVLPPKDYCTPAAGVPEQINLQLAGPDSVVVNWVTFHATPVGDPTVTFGDSKGAGATGTVVKGTSHAYSSPSKDRTYFFHFVILSGLKARGTYFYSVKAGGGSASAEFRFRAPHGSDDSGATTLDVYGDMGVYQWNNMQQLYDDCVAGNAVDGIIHMGDHSYNEGDADERRGDGYMQAFQQTLASCPWVPIVGNHEYYSGEELAKFLNNTVGGRDLPKAMRDAIAAHEAVAAAKSAGALGGAALKASTALGTMLSHGSYLAQGKNADGVQSGTSRYYSLDIGKVHLVALDLNVYYGSDPCGAPCAEAQKQWLAADLAAANANRANVPWIVAMSHYPFYCTGCYSKNAAAQWYVPRTVRTALPAPFFFFFSRALAHTSPPHLDANPQPTLQVCRRRRRVQR